MRIKLFPTISMLLLSAMTMTSCLKSDNQNYEIIPDATIHGFQIDTIPGGFQRDFSIDHARGLIYNIDSLPMHADTVVNKILIKQIITNAAAVYHDDKVMSYQDSVDLSAPFELVTKSIVDPAYTKKYTVEVRVHKLDPDRIDWDEIEAVLPTPATSEVKKIINFKGKTFVYTGADYVFIINDYKDASWVQQTISGIELIDAESKITSYISSEEYIFAIYNNQVYKTIDGINWELLTSDNDIEKLLSIHNSSLYAISTNNKYCAIDLDNTEEGWNEGPTVADNFPETSLTSAIYKRSNLASLLGEYSKDKTSRNIWMTEDGLKWFKLANSNEGKYQYPFLKNPILISYDDILYTIGEEEVTSTVEKEKEDGTKEKETITKQINRIYTSIDGINWEVANTKEQFGKDQMDGKVIESASVDSNNYIWLTIKDEPHVWRGRLNRLGFLQKM